MNKVAKTAIAVVLSFAFCSQAMAAFVLNGTRFIYDENKKILPLRSPIMPVRCMGAGMGG